MDFFIEILAFSASKLVGKVFYISRKDFLEIFEEFWPF